MSVRENWRKKDFSGFQVLFFMGTVFVTMLILLCVAMSGARHNLETIENWESGRYVRKVTGPCVYIKDRKDGSVLSSSCGEKTAEE